MFITCIKNLSLKPWSKFDTKYERTNKYRTESLSRPEVWEQTAAQDHPRRAFRPAPQCTMARHTTYTWDRM